MTSTSSLPQGSPFVPGKSSRKQPAAINTGSPPVTSRRRTSPSPKLAGPQPSPRAQALESPTATRSRRFMFNALNKPASPNSRSSPHSSSAPSTPKSSVWSRTSSIISNFFGRSSPSTPTSAAIAHKRQQHQQHQRQTTSTESSSDSDTDPSNGHMTMDGSIPGATRPSLNVNNPLHKQQQDSPGSPAPGSANLHSHDTMMDDASPMSPDDERMFDGDHHHSTAQASPLSSKENKTPVRDSRNNTSSKNNNNSTAEATGDQKVAEWMIMSSIQSTEDDAALHAAGASAELARQAATIMAAAHPAIPPVEPHRRDSLGSSDGSVVYSHSPSRSARARRARRAHRRSESAASQGLPAHHSYEFDDSSEDGSSYYGSNNNRRQWSRRSDGSVSSASSHASGPHLGGLDEDAPLSHGDLYSAVDGRTLKTQPAAYIEDSEEDYEMEASMPSTHETGYMAPHQSVHSVPKHTLVLDLDETLVHSTIKRPAKYDLEVPVTIEDTHCVFYVRLRPHVREFLAKVCEWYNVVVFTAGLKQYAAPVVEFLDPNGLIKDSFYRESCIQLGGCFIKDLRMTNPDMASTFIVDNSPAAYCLFQDNAVPIISWMGDEEDLELIHLLAILNEIRQAHDVRPLLKAHFGEQIAAQAAQ